MKVSIIGQGYVGLPLALAAAESGFEVMGVDTNSIKVEKLLSGISPVEDITDQYLKSQLGAYRPSNDFADIRGSEIVVFFLPTPLDQKGDPDHSNLLVGASSAAEFVSDNALVINESTVSPGFTRQCFAPLFAGRQIAFSPERVDPLNSWWNLKNTTKLVAGLTETAGRRASAFYSRFIDDVETFDTLEIVECAKLLENSFRLVNISLINEFSQFCDALNTDVYEVIRAASSKPYGFMPFFPSVGAGGHCIPVDPIFLSSHARKLGNPLNLVEMAVKVNDDRSTYLLSVAQNHLGTLGGKKILLVGISYKANISDVRESSALKLLQKLRDAGAEVIWHDEKVKQWNNEFSSPIDEPCDMAIIAQIHDGVMVEAIASKVLISPSGRKIDHLT